MRKVLNETLRVPWEQWQKARMHSKSFLLLLIHHRSRLSPQKKAKAKEPLLHTHFIRRCFRLSYDSLLRANGTRKIISAGIYLQLRVTLNLFLSFFFFFRFFSISSKSQFIQLFFSFFSSPKTVTGELRNYLTVLFRFFFPHRFVSLFTNLLAGARNWWLSCLKRILFTTRPPKWIKKR